MAANSEMQKLQLRRKYENFWHTNLMGTIRADFPYFCFVLWCAPCASYSLRKRALKNDMSNYECCAGYGPCCSGLCGERWCPRLCLCMEVFCCFENSVSSTRFLLQDEFRIQTTQCDICIIRCLSCLQIFSCICSVIVWMAIGNDNSEPLSVISCFATRLIYCMACSCMQTQHKIEMDNRYSKSGEPMAAPPIQQMALVDQ